jgi:hypothetical protein
MFLAGSVQLVHQIESVRFVSRHLESLKRVQSRTLFIEASTAET